ncbi:MAG: citrate synthase [Chloroflexi bacterium]|nr:citrate synthase [Chloroflexota bacterium]MQC48481.1 citrate synthase [Chloroflexota bacterium]
MGGGAPVASGTREGATMTTDTTKLSPGLEGVPIAESALSLVEGQAGRLTYRGYSIEDLTQPGVSFEEVVALLYDGELPTQSRVDEITGLLQEYRELTPEQIELARTAARLTHPMFALQAATAILGPKDNDFEPKVPTLDTRGLELIAKVGHLVGVIAEAIDGREHEGPRKGESHARAMLRMITGEEPTDLQERVMNALLILQADHSAGNASTFTARVVTSTKAEPNATVSAAIGALSGPAHGGANEGSLRLFLEIGNPEEAEATIERMLDDKYKIPGFGHRVYHVKDPRSKVIQTLAGEVIRPGTKEHDNYQIALTVEKVATDRLGDRGLFPNVDLFSGCVFAAIGIPIDIFTPIFAAARTAGWVVNMREQWDSGNRLFRPSQIYVGATHRDFVPMSER